MVGPECLTHTTIIRSAQSVPTFRFDQDGREVASTQRKSLLHVAADGHFGAVTWNPIAFTKHPHGSRAIVNLKDAAPERSKGIDDMPGDRDLLAREPAGVAIDLLDALVRRASGQEQAAENR